MQVEKQKWIKGLLQKKVDTYWLLFFILLSSYAVFLTCIAECIVNKKFFQVFYDWFTGPSYESWYWICTFLLSCLLFISFYFITGNHICAVILPGIPVLLLATAGYYKYEFRKELVRISDFQSGNIGDLVVNAVDWRVTKEMMLAILGMAFFCGFSLWLYRYAKKNGKAVMKWKTRLIFLLVGILLLLGSCRFASFYVNRTQQTIIVENIIDTFSNKNAYVIYNFLKRKGTNASEEDVIKAYDQIKQEVTSVTKPVKVKEIENPNIIVIMSESLWDMNVLVGDSIQYSKDPMETIKRYQEQYGGGTAYTNLYGGGTVQSELEFLTGFGSKFVSVEDFCNYAGEEYIPGFVSYLKEIGYQTTYIHPYYSSSYKREEWIPKIGFDNVFFEDTMQHRQIFDKYISDDAMAEEIIGLYENRNTEKPFFNFSVSVANHMPALSYETDEVGISDMEIQVEVSGEWKPDAYDSLVHHVNGAYEAGKAFEKLATYFEKQKEPVLILMFGDHSPPFSSEELDLSGMEDSKTVKGEDLYKMCSTPVVTWNNFSTEKMDTKQYSVSYLSTLITEYCGLPQSYMTQINDVLMSRYRHLGERFVLDADGKEKMQFEPDEADFLSNLSILQSDIIFGQGICNDIWKPIIENPDK